VKYIKSGSKGLALIYYSGDFNAWSAEWGSAKNDVRGFKLADLAASINLVPANVGHVPTYHRINAEILRYIHPTVWAGLPGILDGSRTR
jgi:hypothetical protein